MLCLVAAEKTSKKMEEPASRFIGTDELTNTYKNATPGQSVKKIVKKVVEEGVLIIYFLLLTIKILYK